MQMANCMYIQTRRILQKKAARLQLCCIWIWLILDTMDVKISLETEKAMLTTRFCLNEDVVAFMQEHMEELTQRLTRTGYVCKTYVEPRQEQKVSYGYHGRTVWSCCYTA